MSTERKHYVGEVGIELILDCGGSVVGATAYCIKVKKPNFTEADWTAEIYNSNYLRHLIGADELDQAGNWEFQAYIEISGLKRYGSTCNIVVYDKFS